MLGPIIIKYIVCENYIALKIIYRLVTFGKYSSCITISDPRIDWVQIFLSRIFIKGISINFHLIWSTNKDCSTSLCSRVIVKRGIYDLRLLLSCQIWCEINFYCWALCWHKIWEFRILDIYSLTVKTFDTKWIVKSFILRNFAF